MVIIIEITVMLLISIMYITLLERKWMGKTQSRTGPSEVGIWGISQPILDGIKLYLKERIIPIQVSKELYKSTSKIFIFISIIISLYAPLWKRSIEGERRWILNKEIDNIVIYGIITTLSGYSILFSGWSSNNNYSKLGSIRCISQVISNEVYVTIIYIIMMIRNNNLGIKETNWNSIEIEWSISLGLLPLIYLIWLISETNRTPFDISEGESELVSGWNVEYSSIYFASFMIGEYGIIIILSNISSLLLFKYIYPWSLFLLLICFILFRATYSRLRQDSILILSWKYILPICLFLLLYYLVI